MILGIGWCVRVLAVASLCCLTGCQSKARAYKLADQETQAFNRYRNVGLDLKKGAGVDVDTWYEYMEVSRVAYANKFADAAYMLAFMHQHARFADLNLRAAHYWHFRHLMHGVGSGPGEKMSRPLRIWTERDRFAAWFRARGFLDGWARKPRLPDGMAWFLYWASVGDARGFYPTPSNQIDCVPLQRRAKLPETDLYAGARGLKVLLANVRHMSSRMPGGGSLKNYDYLATMTRDQVVALYRSGHGEGREGMKKIILAADWGLTEAQLEAARLYAQSGDSASAHFYFLRAALGGDGGAAFEVAIDYEKGRGTDKDLLEAWAWYRLAAHSGPGKQATERLRSLSSPERAGEWDRTDLGLVKPNSWVSQRP